MNFFTYGNCRRPCYAQHFTERKVVVPSLLTKTIMRINLVALLLTLSIVHVWASVHGQDINISVNHAPLKVVLNEIKKQSGFQFLYNNSLLEKTQTVTLNLRHASLKDALDQTFKNQPLNYEILDKTIVIKAKEKSALDRITNFFRSLFITGKITDETGRAIPGVTIQVKGKSKTTVSDNQGIYKIEADAGDILVFSSVGFITQQITVDDVTTVDITLKETTGQLDQVQIIGYGTTTKRLNTGNVYSIKADVIAQQPITNPLQALEGRVPGMFISQTSGLPGSNMSTQIRGQNSISSGNSPLYIVDGVPFPSSSLDLVLGANAPAFGGISTLNSINPADIESIEILKDADATAIYGSRGANGVILITTKKGKEGKTIFDFKLSSGVGKVTRTLPVLNPQQYYDLRQEAFKNDGVSPNATNAPDLLVWDKTRTTDFQKLLIGNTAHTADFTGAVSGGGSNTTFFLSGTHHYESTVFGNDQGYRRTNVHVSLGHNSTDKKFSINFTASFTSDLNHINSTDLTPYYNLPPNYPLYNADGKLNWEAGITNPLSFLQQPYKAQTDNLNANTVLQYKVLKDLTVKVNLGYNKIDLDQQALMPASSQNPAYSPTGYAFFVTNGKKTYIIEPQIDYKKSFGKLLLSALVGGTYQKTQSKANYLYGYNYATDALLQSPSAAGGTYISTSNIPYKYASLFGRVNLNWDGKYILNGTFRRDGSSRFGPGKQYGDFGAIGTAWIFSEEPWLKKSLQWVSFGKIRASYGTVGNDQIPDYGYLSTYTSSNYTYGGSPGIYPYGIANTDYSWEVTKKLEGAIELGFLKDRLLFNASVFRNRSGNQLLGHVLATQTGFGSVEANLPALVQNTGFELSLNTINIKNRDFTWSSNINFTQTKNKLLSYPGLSDSYDANYYAIGEPLAPIILFHSTGINPQNGLPTVADINHDGHISYGLSVNNQGDQVIAGTTAPKFYGGVSNNLTYKNWQLDFLFQFVKQKGLGILSHIPNPAGTMFNSYSGVLNRWRNPGDVTTIPAATTTAGTDAFNAYNNYYQSDAVLSDASFIRLKNVSLSYDIQLGKRSGIKSDRLRVYLQGQNLLTFTKYLGFDPENSGSIGLPILPPLRTITAGLQCTF